MLQTTDFTDWSLAQLAAACQQETRQFWQGNLQNPRYCFELFCRALAQPDLETSKQAWNLIHEQYHRQAVVWVKRHPKFAYTDEDPDVMAHMALGEMWRAFATAPNKLSRFPLSDPDKCLRSLLNYLKACVHTVVEGYGQTVPVVPLMEEIEAQPATASSEAFWRCIYRRLTDERERLVIDACFVYELKPRQILESYPHLFRDIKEIYRIKENVLARFERDARLQDCLEGAI